VEIDFAAPLLRRRLRDLPATILIHAASLWPHVDHSMLPRSKCQGEGQNIGHFPVTTCVPLGSTLSADQQAIVTREDGPALTAVHAGMEGGSSVRRFDVTRVQE
jgi:hypothetical protein